LGTKILSCCVTSWIVSYIVPSGNSIVFSSPWDGLFLWVCYYPAITPPFRKTKSTIISIGPALSFLCLRYLWKRIKLRMNKWSPLNRWSQKRCCHSLCIYPLSLCFTAYINKGEGPVQPCVSWFFNLFYFTIFWHISERTWRCENHFWPNLSTQKWAPDRHENQVEVNAGTKEPFIVCLSDDWLSRD
jgi:hypothetical protein